MNFSPLRIDARMILPYGAHLISGSFIIHQRHHFAETNRWPEKPTWARSSEVVDSFATIYHNVAQLRAKYPSAILLVSQMSGPPDALPLPIEVFGKYTNARVHVPFVVMADGDFHECDEPSLENHLFEIGSGDFFDFGGMMDDLAQFGITLLLSRGGTRLEELKDFMEGVSQADLLRERFLNWIDVFLAPTEETDFVLVTKDLEVAEALSRASHQSLQSSRRKRRTDAGT